jgi:hypothetical protein
MDSSILEIKDMRSKMQTQMEQQNEMKWIRRLKS